MATIADLTEDFTGGAPGVAISTANTIADAVSGAGTAVFITDPFDAARQMAEFTTAAQLRSMQADFPAVTKAWIRFDLDVETTPDTSTGVASLYDDTASTNKILDVRVLTTRALQLRNVSTAVSGFGPVLAADTKYRVYVLADMTPGTPVIRCVVYGGANLDTLVLDSGDIASTSLAAAAGSARFGLISSSTGVVRIGRLRGDDAVMPLDTTPFGTPAGLTVEPVSSTQLDVTWQEVQGAVGGYDLERVGGSGGTLVRNLTAPPLNDTGLEPATQYTYRVRAVQ